MPLVVGVTFRKVGKVYYFDPGELALREGDFVIAETARGVEFGEVVIEPREVSEEDLVAPLKRIVRVATGQDLEREATNREKEQYAFEVCERKIAEHNLPMRLLEAEYTFDGSQVTFSFCADGRVDFRELVKDVAGVLRTKVQLHQIGVRDEAKLIGGYGTCGRPLCCATFLSSFEPISMKMAKDQSLFLNPAKFSGVCGKLMCCLRYEHEFYKEAQRYLPAVGAIIPWGEGRAKVLDVNVVSNTLTIETETDVQLHVRADEVKLEGLCRRHGIACNMSERNCEPLGAGSSGRDSDELDEDDAAFVCVEPDAEELDEVNYEQVVVPKSTGVSWREPRPPSPLPDNAPTQNNANKEPRSNKNGGGSRSGRRRSYRPRGNESQKGSKS